MANARHSKAGRFVKQQLFAGLSTFVELEQRITDLPDEKARGDAFEVFAEAYLATQRKHDAETVWPLSSVPTETLGNLQLATQDYGVDGVLKTRLGKFSAYQVKFRTGRVALTWRELSKFIGLADSPNIHSRILLTNCDEVAAVLNDRQEFFCIRGSDLDRLEPEDFKTIEAWLANSAYQAPKKTPLPHQTEALDKILPAFGKHDRVSAIMACGTGKTLVALWVAEKMQAQRILVLLPSLALLRQTLHEWMRETSIQWPYLCVCSDDTVIEGLDALKTQQSDLDFEVSTDSSKVRSFLDAPFAGVKMIFSTYQSAHKIGEAIQPGESFDFAVFDEAHKTAGREGRNYAFALEDANLPIRKRLFLTATPRHYNPHQHDQEDEAQLVFSMDRPDVYGPQAFRLTFAEAARRGIICGYKVIISVITSEMVTNALLSRSEVLVNGDTVRARQVANQIALHDAIEKYGASKVFTFHKTVASAASFVADGSEGVRTHLPEFRTFHVNGTMPTARREREMRDFRAAARAVMSNARCLTEGVDVPAVDLVAFLSPRRSRVDIVQATGRAMRRSPGKAVGYVLIPLYVEMEGGETIEQAVRRTDFDEVWDVLNSLQEQDDVLAELIRHIGEAKGQGKGFDDARLADRIDFGGTRLTLETLRIAVTTLCLESLYSSWDEWFGKLLSFKERFGHCNIEAGWKEDPALASWVSAQRTRLTKGTLDEERVRRLKEIEFDPNWQDTKKDETWMQWYRMLEEYTQQHGNSHVTRKHHDIKLYNWVMTQRQRSRGKTKDGPHTQEQVAYLNKLGFRWGRQDKWDEKFEEFKQFIAKHGHCEVALELGNKNTLAGWLNNQRSNQASNELPANRKALLDAACPGWEQPKTFDLKWQEMYERLRAYRINHGDADVPQGWKDDLKLARWVLAQRQRRKNEDLSREQIELLDQLNFTWVGHERGTWEQTFQELVQYKEKHGHCDVPYNDPNGKLARFVNSMRTQRNSGKLSDERITKLETIDFPWTSTAWKMKFDELVRYKTVHGDCDVPSKWPQNPELANWVSNLRQSKKQGKLDSERERLLNDLGFIWEKRIRSSRD